jgi:hypothetical protein
MNYDTWLMPLVPFTWLMPLVPFTVLLDQVYESYVCLWRFQHGVFAVSLPTLQMQ